MTSPAAADGAFESVRYRVDADDRIVATNEAWDRFALANDSPHLVGARVRGSSLWDHVGDQSLRYLQRELFARVRARSQPVRVPFRCDAPALVRRMELAIEPAGDGAIDLTAAFLAVEPRQPVLLLDPRLSREGNAVVVCSWCKRAETDLGWLEIEDAARRVGLFERDSLPPVTHGLCPDCARIFFDA